MSSLNIPQKDIVLVAIEYTQVGITLCKIKTIILETSNAWRNIQQTIIISQQQGRRCRSHCQN